MIFTKKRYLVVAELNTDYNGTLLELNTDRILKDLQIHILPEKSGGHDYRAKGKKGKGKGARFIGSVEVTADRKNPNNHVIKNDGNDKEEENIVKCIRYLTIGAYKEIQEFILDGTESEEHQKAISDKMKSIVREGKINSYNPSKFKKPCLDAYYKDYGEYPPDNTKYKLTKNSR